MLAVWSINYPPTNIITATANWQPLALFHHVCGFAPAPIIVLESGSSGTGTNYPRKDDNLTDLILTNEPISLPMKMTGDVKAVFRREFFFISPTAGRCALAALHSQSLTHS
jgi:hypothetical protein